MHGQQNIKIQGNCQNFDGQAWTKFTWLLTRKCSGLYWTRYWSFWFNYTWGIFWL